MPALRLSGLCAARRYVAEHRDNQLAQVPVDHGGNIIRVRSGVQPRAGQHGTEVVMLERYFVKPVTVDRIRASWIGERIERYVGWLSEHGYASRNVFRRVPILVQFGAFAAARGAR